MNLLVWVVVNLKEVNDYVKLLNNTKQVIDEFDGFGENK